MFQKQLVELIKNTSTTIPLDIQESLIQARNIEEKGSNAQLSLDTILKNLELAKSAQTPVCQDTGFPSFFVKLPVGMSQKDFKVEVLDAIRTATQKGYLRPNAVDSVTGENSGDNTGEEFPKIYFEESDDEYVYVDLILKGGGSENVSDQIALPAQLPDYGKAGRNLEGVKKSVLQVIKNAQGKGCAPGIISVHIGADRSSGYYLAKKNLLKPLGTEVKNQDLAQLQSEILVEANQMGIGPMGFGGKTTILDCKISSSHRLPASFYVTVCYMCWACRRGGIVLDQNAKVIESQEGISPDLSSLGSQEPQNIKRLNFPVTEEDVRDLNAGDIVFLNGIIFTGRDALHSHVIDNDVDLDLTGSAIYHCGPVALQNEDKTWKFTAAGPTTSIREEPYQADFLKKTGARAVIGKGGMGDKTLKGLQEHGAVYLHAIGGAAAYYAQSIKQVKSVEFLEFGIPEAMWEIEVEDFMCVVTMDSKGKSLHT